MNTCVWCPSPAVRKQGRIWLCWKHYRFMSMRCRAARDGKLVPSYAELEAMFADQGMVCSGCERTMVWSMNDDKCLVVTLQHNKDGTLTFLCKTCNSRHASIGEKAFYEKDQRVRVCRGCRRSKPMYRFPLRPSGRDWDARSDVCEKCC